MSYISSLLVTEHGVLENPRTWALEPYIDTTAINRYSGSQQTGDNSSANAGDLVDALAHFSVNYTNGTLLWTDIEGGMN